MKTIGFVILAFVFFVGASGAEVTSEAHFSSSAHPIQTEGVPNFHKISEDLYRSGQPTAKGFRNLKAMGIKTVIDLRWLHSDRNEARDSGLEYEHINMVAWSPDESDAVKFLQIVTDKKRTPVLVHCQYGADRTGTMCAVYRIALQGWTKEKALKEMVEGGFGFHGIWGNLVQWIRKLDVDKIREKAGVVRDMELVFPAPWIPKAPGCRNDATKMDPDQKEASHGSL